MMKPLPIHTKLFGLICLVVGVQSAQAEQSLTFPIHRFEISGNTLLQENELQTLVAPHTGKDRSFANIQLAQEALERAFRRLGYSAVAVTLPEQDISAGVIRFNIIEGRLGNISVTGNRNYSESNVRNSLPSLSPGAMPHATRLAENVSLANENPAKHTEVLLKLSGEVGKVDAEIKVDEENPSRFVISLDNTGTSNAGGKYRMGLAWQHANVFDRDHVVAVQYTTSPEHMSQVKQLNVGYHVPLYDLGDSLDMYAGYSNVDAGGLAGTIESFVGKGAIAGMRYNQNLPRLGEYSHTLKYGLDWKRFDSDCVGPACLVIGNNVTATPVSVSYLGDWTRPNAQTTFAASYFHNLGWGSHNNDATYAGATHQLGSFGAIQGYSLWRFNATQLNVLPAGLQSRLNLSAQYTTDSLIPGEQMGLTGASTVRGFDERFVARDRGFVLNVELYSPDWSKHLPFAAQQARALVFIDHAQGKYVRNASETDNLDQRVTSIGMGLRVTASKHTNMKLDVAKPVSKLAPDVAKDWKAHLLVSTSL